ncbi:MAG: restriction endonuclease subunit S [Methanosphaera sp.]|nr:restriction endonuclease subunit S [Methanosphaera sp.]
MTYKKLSEIAQIFTGIRTSRYKNIVEGTQTKILLNKLHNNQIEYEEIKINKPQQKYYSQKNDIIIHLSDTTNITLLKQENILIPLNYAIIRLKKDYNPEYVYQILKSTHFQNTINKIREGSSIKFIKINDLKNIKIQILETEKQKKYAKIMQLLKKRTQLNKKKIEIEEKYLNGIIQKQLGGKYVKL